MPAPARPRRSLLYVPGDKPRALEKARNLAADGLIVDLEDSVAPDAKAQARETVAAAIGAGGYGARELLLRLSAADAAEDFALANTLALDGVLLPKVESAEAVRAAAARTPHRLWCMIETPAGVLRASEIAASSPQLAGLVMGSNDLAKDLRARQTPDRAALMPSLAWMLLAARAHGLAAIDGVHTRLDDADGFEAACRQAADMGYDGKSLVHPDTIDAANRVFAPAPDELAHARAIVAAWHEARAAGRGVARIEGRMVEQLHVDEANRLIAFADAIAAR